MAKFGRMNNEELKKFREGLAKIKEEQLEDFLKSCVKELAARLLAKVIQRTHAGDYSKEIQVTAKRDSKHHRKGDTYTKRVNPSGKLGGTLRRGWTAKTHEEAASGSGRGADAKAYAESLTINHSGNMFVVEIINPVEYASYVEYGHRTRNHTGWVPGKFMMTISESELRTIAPKVLQAKLEKFLMGCMQ